MYYKLFDFSSFHLHSLFFPGLPVPVSHSNLYNGHKRHQNSYIVRVESSFIHSNIIRNARSVPRETKKTIVKPKPPKRVGRSGISIPTEIGSHLFGMQDMVFLSPNNTELLAHQGSTVTLSCKLTKSPNFGMVSSIKQVY